MICASRSTKDFQVPYFQETELLFQKWMNGCLLSTLKEAKFLKVTAGWLIKAINLEFFPLGQVLQTNWTILFYDNRPS